MDIDGNIYCPRCMRRLPDTDPEVSVCPLCGRDPAVLRPLMALETGTLLAGRYQLADVIGQGGFGITYAAWDETLGMPVAVKEYFPREDASRETELSDELTPFPGKEARYADGLNRFRRESNLLASLQGIPCVVKVMDFFSENGTAYIVMEFVHGQPIDHWVMESRIKPADLLEKLRPVFDALVRTHSQGVIHRDITPDNLLVREDGSLTLIDFGSAVELSQSEGTVLLTRKYAPVEQYSRDNGLQGPWTDVYGLAAVLYTLFSGQEPVEAPLRAHDDNQKPLSRLRTGLKHREAAAIDKALIVSPEKRTQSMAEFRAKLYNLPMPEEIVRRRRFVRRMIAVTTLFLILLALVALNFTTGLPIGSSLLGSFRSNGVWIVNRLQSQEEMTIPDSVLGIPVSEIRTNAFRGDSKLQHVDIPGTVHTIGDSAFYNCTNLEKATLEEGVETIGISAFGACYNLTELTLPDSLTGFGDNAIPADAELLTVFGKRGSEAEHYSNENELRFTDRLELSFLTVGDMVAILDIKTDAARLTLPNTLDGIPVKTIKEGIHLLKQEEVWLPEYLEVVPAQLFTEDGHDTHDNENLKSVRLGRHVQEIGAYAFLCCKELKTLRFPDTLKRIDLEAFYDCGLTEINLPDGLQEIGRHAFGQLPVTLISLPDSLQSIDNAVFYRDEQLTEINLPNTIQSIPERTFAYSGLTYLIVPDSVTSIESNAFIGCSKLRFIMIPTSVESISDSAFEGTRADLIIAGYAGSEAEAFAQRAGINFENINEWTQPDEWKDGNTAVYHADRAEKIIRIPHYNEQDHCLVTGCEYKNNKYVEEVILPPFQTEISQYSFSSDTALRRVSSEGEITTIGQGAFISCASLEDFPQKSVEIIEDYALEHCSSLTSLSLDKIIRIGSFAFGECTSLKEMYLPDSLTEIFPNAFEKCISLKYVVLPSHLRDLDTWAFNECSSLELVIISEGCALKLKPDATIGQFSRCPSLRTIYLPSTIHLVEPDNLRNSFRDIWVFNPEAEYVANEAGFYTSEGYVKTPYWSREGWYTLHGYAGSTAEAWASEFYADFEPIPDDMTSLDPWEIVKSYAFSE